MAKIHPHHVTLIQPPVHSQIFLRFNLFHHLVMYLQTFFQRQLKAILLITLLHYNFGTIVQQLLILHALLRNLLLQSIPLTLILLIFLLELIQSKQQIMVSILAHLNCKYTLIFKHLHLPYQPMFHFYFDYLVKSKHIK